MMTYAQKEYPGIFIYLSHSRNYLAPKLKVEIITTEKNLPKDIYFDILTSFFSQYILDLC